MPSYRGSASHVTVRHDGTAIPANSHLVLARLGVDAPITDVQVHGGVMDVPRDPSRVGWWTAGSAPGADHGSIVIVGHINFAGTSGALSVLPRARPGDIVVVEEQTQTPRLRYRIVAVRSYPKTSGIPQAVFAASGPARLVLVTCGGPFDSSTGNYEDNIVGYAEPI